MDEHEMDESDLLRKIIADQEAWAKLADIEIGPPRSVIINGDMIDLGPMRPGAHDVVVVKPDPSFHSLALSLLRKAHAMDQFNEDEVPKFEFIGEFMDEEPDDE